MLQTRIWMGAVLIALSVGVLVLDQSLSPWCPFLFILLLSLSLAASLELLRLLDPVRRPPIWFCLSGVAAMILFNWMAHVIPLVTPASAAIWDPWQWIVLVFVGVVLGAFLLEMMIFHEPGVSVTRIALTVWIVAYLGVLPSFLAQLRWPVDVFTPAHGISRGTLTLALAIFVPKCCDIGAYFTGMAIGRHQMTPVLSPKKTWEGAVGGLVAAALAAVWLDSLGPVLRGGWQSAAVLGVALGIAGMLGDLAESLIKRDCKQKDASHAVPGFGGVLDVIDSVVFAAPLAYCLLR